MSVVNTPHFVLASASPRRQQLLRQIGFDPVCLPVSVNEQPLQSEAPGTLVVRLARQKAERCLQELVETGGYDDGDTVVVLGADTVIDLDGEVLGKPAGKSDALTMLKRLANREHLVLTGVCVLHADFTRLAHRVDKHEVCVSTIVRFGPVSDDQAETYWQTGEPADKAGSYAIQGIGAQFVAHLSGSYSNVVGLPLYETNRLLRQAGLSANNPA